MKKPAIFLLPIAALFTLDSCRNAGTKTSSGDTVRATSAELADTPAFVTTTAKSADIPADVAGVWVEDAARAKAEGADAEAAITLCEGGRASYAVFSNQLFVFMKVARSATGDVYSFYFDGEDVGSGFRNAGLYSPAPDALMGTGRVQDGNVLAMDWSPAKDYISSIRTAAPKESGRTIFPEKFYHNATAMAGLCEERE